MENEINYQDEIAGKLINADKFLVITKKTEGQVDFRVLAKGTNYSIRWDDHTENQDGNLELSLALKLSDGFNQVGGIFTLNKLESTILNNNLIKNQLSEIKAYYEHLKKDNLIRRPLLEQYAF